MSTYGNSRRWSAAHGSEPTTGPSSFTRSMADQPWLLDTAEDDEDDFEEDDLAGFMPFAEAVKDQARQAALALNSPQQQGKNKRRKRKKRRPERTALLVICSVTAGGLVGYAVAHIGAAVVRGTARRVEGYLGGG
jgi:hypothetical protein